MVRGILRGTRGRGGSILPVPRLYRVSVLVPWGEGQNSTDPWSIHGLPISYGLGTGPSVRGIEGDRGTGFHRRTGGTRSQKGRYVTLQPEF